MSKASQRKKQAEQRNLKLYHMGISVANRMRKGKKVFQDQVHSDSMSWRHGYLFATGKPFWRNKNADRKRLEKLAQLTTTRPTFGMEHV